MADTNTGMRISQVGTVMVPVSNQDDAIEFFTGKLGFEKRSDTPFGNGDRWVEVAPAGSATTLALVPAREGEAGGVMTRIAFSTSDVDADYEGLKAQGIDVDAEIMRPGDPVPPMFFFRDPDGNTFLDVQTS